MSEVSTPRLSVTISTQTWMALIKTADIAANSRHDLHCPARGHRGHRRGLCECHVRTAKAAIELL